MYWLHKELWSCPTCQTRSSTMKQEAREWLEARVWAKGRCCPHCGAVDQSTLMRGKTTRAGLYQCNACREPFTVTVGTLYERSKVPLHKWLAVTHLMMASKKGMSALQISRMISLSYKTTWFLCHRIRELLKASPDLSPIGGANKVMEADETYVGGKQRAAPAPKKAVFTCRARRPCSFVSRRERHGDDASSDHRKERRTGVNAYDR